MKNSIFFCLLIFFSINAIADCPEYEVSLDESKVLGYSPNQIEICTVSLRYDMGFGHSQKITVVCFNAELLPQQILHCYRGEEEYFIIDDVEVSNDPKELFKYGIYTVFPSVDSQVGIQLLENGSYFKIENHTSRIYNGESDLETFLYTWDGDLKNYSFTEKKSVSMPEERIKEMEASIASGDLETLTQQLQSYDFGGGYGASLNKLPKKFSEKLWTALHEKTLALYKQGNKKEAALLVDNILDVVEVSATDDLIDFINDQEDEFWINYGVDVLNQNPKLLTAISDCAFFLEQGDLGLESASAIFIYILNKYPKRAATYLNLADAFWKLENFEKAKNNYQTYVELLVAKDKSNVIPSYVYKRLDR